MGYTEASRKAQKKYRSKLRKEKKLYTIRLDIYDSKNKELIEHLKDLAKLKKQRSWIINTLDKQRKKEKKK